MQKEFIQIVRDRTTLLILLSMPLMQLFLFSYAINMNVRHIRLAVADQDRDAESRAYLDSLVQSGSFDLVLTVPDQAALQRAIDQGAVSAGVLIPRDFHEQVARGKGQVLLLVDGSDLFTSQSAYNAAAAIAQSYASGIVLSQIERSGRAGAGFLPLDAHIRILYNPDMKDLWFIVPGMLATLLQTQSITLTAAAVVREREQGTIEQILVTPIQPVELMLGKIAPNVMIAMINLLTIVALGRWWFGVPFQGNFWLFVELSLLFVFSGLGLGLLISTVSQNQRQAQQFIQMFFMLGTVLAGFVFPRYAMPVALQWIGNIFPLTHFIPVSRGIITKGIGLESLGNEVLALLVYVVLIVVLAARSFRRRLD